MRAESFFTMKMSSFLHESRPKEPPESMPQPVATPAAPPPPQYDDMYGMSAPYVPQLAQHSQMERPAQYPAPAQLAQPAQQQYASVEMPPMRPVQQWSKRQALAAQAPHQPAHQASQGQYYQQSPAPPAAVYQQPLQTSYGTPKIVNGYDYGKQRVGMVNSATMRVDSWATSPQPRPNAPLTAKPTFAVGPAPSWSQANAAVRGRSPQVAPPASDFAAMQTQGATRGQSASRAPWHDEDRAKTNPPRNGRGANSDSSAQQRERGVGNGSSSDGSGLPRRPYPRASSVPPQPVPVECRDGETSVVKWQPPDIRARGFHDIQTESPQLDERYARIPQQSFFGFCC